MCSYQDGDFPDIFIRVARPGEHHEIRDQFEALRYQVFSVLYGWEAQNAEARERDHYDRRGKTTYVVAFQDGVMVGGCRIIEGDYLPVQKAMKCYTLPNACEVSRMLVCPSVRSEGMRAIIEAKLYEHVYTYVFVDSGYEALYSHIRTCYLRMFRKIYGRWFFVEAGLPKKHKKNGNTISLIPVVGTAFTMFACATGELPVKTSGVITVLTSDRATKLKPPPPPRLLPDGRPAELAFIDNPRANLRAKDKRNRRDRQGVVQEAFTA